MAMNKDLKAIAMLFLALFVIGIIVGVSYLGFDALKGSMCTQDVSTHVWTGGECQVSSTNSTAVTVTSITKISIVEGALDIALGLLGLVVLMLIFAIVIRAAVGFAKTGKGQGF